MWEIIVSHTFVQSGFSEETEQIHSRNLTKFNSGFAPTKTNFSMLFNDKGISLIFGKMESKYHLL